MVQVEGRVFEGAVRTSVRTQKFNQMPPIPFDRYGPLDADAYANLINILHEAQKRADEFGVQPSFTAATVYGFWIAEFDDVTYKYFVGMQKTPTVAMPVLLSADFVRSRFDLVGKYALIPATSVVLLMQALNDELPAVQEMGIEPYLDALLSGLKEGR